MNYANMKIYFDGGHYVGIPKGAFPSGKGCKRRAVKPMKQQSTANVTPPNTPKERFETAYKESQSLPKRERKAHIKAALKDDFKDKAELNAFVEKHTERMKTNAIKRKVRLMRKLRLQDWNYFVTVTHFYGHSFSLDNNPPNISPFRQKWVAQRKSEVNGKNCHLKFVCIGKAKVERFQPWLYFYAIKN